MTAAVLRMGLMIVAGDRLGGRLVQALDVYRKSNPYVLMVQAAKDRPRFDAPRALNDPSNRRILA
jgi:hypothetical protein